MAESPKTTLSFTGSCPDCAVRRVDLPRSLPELGDDFDWLQRDYDSFRLGMLEELAARFPERQRWSPADLEVVLAETLAVALDQLSDMLDRVHGEAFLETARRPDSVYRLLKFIGYDALEASDLVFDPTDDAQKQAALQQLMQQWLTYPNAMQAAKVDGPRSIQRQRRMVTLDDYVTQLESHPLIERAQAGSFWSGSWTTLEIAILAIERAALDKRVSAIFGPGSAATISLQTSIDAFHRFHDLDLINWSHDPAVRSVVREFLDAYRMAGQEIWLADPVHVGVLIDLTILVAKNFYRSEVTDAVRDALGTGTNGFFAASRLRFGEDLHASDIIDAVMQVDGVETVCLNRFKRLGPRFADQSDGGRIILDGREIANCANIPGDPSQGILTLRPHGGQAG